MSKHSKRKTALIIGRWQPWHKGHRSLFEAALDRAERVAIGVRHTHATDGKNPFTFKEVKEFIDKDLSEEFYGMYDVIELPNITNVIYGRDVGYKVEKISLGEDIEKISATEVRKSMNLTPASHNVSYEDRIKRNGHEGGVLWLTGLSGSGKTTLAQLAEKELYSHGCSVYMLDGDNLRDGLNSNLGFSPEDRTENIRRASEVAALLASTGCIVIASFISPFINDRENARKVCKNNFYEIFLSAELEVCEKRDPKGLYKKARAGIIKDFTGIGSPYDTPSNPDLLIQTGIESFEKSSIQLNSFIKEKFNLKI
jgi:adenylyl-sulfate kinase